MDRDNQVEYWNSVADKKTFTHSIALEWFGETVRCDGRIVDFGCGYGRVVAILLDAGFTNVVGYDTSEQMVERGRKSRNLPLHSIRTPADLPEEERSVDCIVLCAVLTCIPSNKGQRELLEMLCSRLKPGGLFYISDYHVNEESVKSGRYYHLDGDESNDSVFNHPEGAVFRHHTKEWIASLLRDLEILHEKTFEAVTMNGHAAKGFQIMARKSRTAKAP